MKNELDSVALEFVICELHSVTCGEISFLPVTMCGKQMLTGIHEFSTNVTMPTVIFENPTGGRKSGITAQ